MSKKLSHIVVVEHENIAGEPCISYQIKKLEEYSADAGERALTHSFLRDSHRKLMGRTLTIIDASISDKQQNKAIKDLIRNIFSDELNFGSDMAFDQAELQATIPENAAFMPPVTIEEALGVDNIS